MKEINEIVGKNLTRLRLEKNWTQSDLALKLNYSDKAVSKWENGDAMPPIETLIQLSDLYNVSLDYIVSEDFDQTHDKTYYSKENQANKLIITLLAVSFIWLIAIIGYVYGVTLANNYMLWKLFVGAVPVSCIVLFVFNGIWGKRKFTFIIASVFVWTLIATIYILLLDDNPWLIFFIGIPLQIGIVLWSQLKVNKTKKGVKR